MSTQLDALISELAGIQERLLAEPSLEERATLHDRQEELRAAGRELRKTAGDDPSLDQARAQLNHLEERRLALVSAHVPHANSPALAAGTGMSRWNLHGYSPAPLDSFDLDALELEIHHLREHIMSLEAN
jgi:multidrug efflux pump subunit AcrA (membrane-fusion protein)